MEKTLRRRLIASGILLGALALLVLLAVLGGGWFFSFYPAVSRFLTGLLAAVTGLFPFAVCEFLLYGLIVWGIVSLVLAIRKRRVVRWLSGLLLGFSIGLTAFTALWGLNHFGPSVAQRLSLEEGQYTQQQLEEAARYFLAMAGQTGAELARDEAGAVQMPSFSDLAEQAGAGYEALRERYNSFDGSTVRVKRVTNWPMLSAFGVTGIFVCFTGESCVNPDTYAASLPFTMCHELGHRMAVAAEDEANFCAFLACIENPAAEFQYSGWYCAFVYCYNALWRVSPSAARSLLSEAEPFVLADLAAASAHYAKYDGPVQSAAQKVNDVYLKAFSESSGVQSYGEVADLLLAWYLAEKNA